MATKRYSKQRELILEAVMNTDRHPTAETVYNWLKPENPALSLGTVYRNLNQLAEDGSIIKLSFPVERYDANISPHAHFMCRDCGNVYDLEGISYDSSLDEFVETLNGHSVERHDLMFIGICKDCTKKL